MKDMCNEIANYEVFNFSIIRTGRNFLKVKNVVQKITNVVVQCRGGVIVIYEL